MTNAAIIEIAYHFGDASVPPDYHRSYSIAVTADKVRVVVDCYGDILADKEYAITPLQFDDLKRSLERNGIRKLTSVDDENCSGGTSERITYSDKRNELFSGTVYHCGGKDTGNLGGDISSFAEDVKSLAPDLDKLLQ
ncbi:MAG: hypothetical protein H8E53_07335 [Planctomycetes bacterium]|nr:hypothetical protein [Planctomycetota bacterium]